MTEQMRTWMYSLDDGTTFSTGDETPPLSREQAIYVAQCALYDEGMEPDSECGIVVAAYVEERVSQLYLSVDDVLEGILCKSEHDMWDGHEFGWDKNTLKARSAKLELQHALRKVFDKWSDEHGFVTSVWVPDGAEEALMVSPIKED